MFSRIYCGQIELSVATLYCTGMRRRSAVAAFFPSNRFTKSCRGLVSFFRINTPIHSLIHPFTENKLTHARSHYHEQEWMCFSFFFFFCHFVFVFVQLFRELQHDRTEKWWVHLRPNKKKCLQSVVAVVPNGSYARQSKSYSSRFLVNNVCECIVIRVRRAIRANVFETMCRVWAFVHWRQTNCLSFVVAIESDDKENAFAATNLWSVQRK